MEVTKALGVHVNFRNSTCWWKFQGLKQVVNSRYLLMVLSMPFRVFGKFREKPQQKSHRNCWSQRFRHSEEKKRTTVYIRNWKVQSRWAVKIMIISEVEQTSLICPSESNYKQFAWDTNSMILAWETKIQTNLIGYRESVLFKPRRKRRQSILAGIPVQHTLYMTDLHYKSLTRQKWWRFWDSHTHP